MTAGRNVTVAAVALAVTLGGCRAAPPGEFAATLDGGIAGEIHGGAVLCRHGDGWRLVLRDPKTTAGFVLSRAGADVPTPGSYGIRRAGPEAGTAFTLEPLLSGAGIGDEYGYRVEGGKVRIIRSDTTAVEGRLESEIVAFDTAFTVDTESKQVRRLPTTTIEVNGRFRAVRADGCALEE